MSMVNQTPQCGRGPKVRVVIAATVAALLLGSSFYAAQAGNNSGYDSDLDGAEIAAIVVGGIGVGAIVFGVMSKDDDDEESSAAKAKSAKAVEQLRVVPSQSRLGAGDSATVEVQAQYQGSKTWENVTSLANVHLVSGGLTPVDGSKNAFAVPYGSKVVSGNATIAASFGGQNASTLVAVN
jgi:hypothetical protein